MQSVERFSAFDGSEIFFEGTLPEVTEAIRCRLAKLPDSQILVFSQTTGRQTDVYLDLPGYEEGLRCLFANNRECLKEQINEWPVDLKRFTLQLAFPT